MKHICTLVALLLCSCLLHAQITFGIQVPAREMGKDDVLDVDYVINGAAAVEDFDDPVFKGWQLLQGPMEQMMQNNLNGKVTELVKFTYTLKPLHTGVLNIPAVSVKVNGRRYNCAAAHITVKNTAHLLPQQQQGGVQIAGGTLLMDPGQPDVALSNDYLLKPGETLQDRMKNNLLVRAFCSKPVCVVGEPVLVTYKLFMGLDVQAQIQKQPVFKGCSVQELTTTNMPPTAEVLNGKTYRVFIIRKVQLIPLQAGKITLDTAAVEADVTLLKASSSTRDRYYGNTEKVNGRYIAQSKPLTIEVLPLPAKPAHFKGAVGRFTITAIADKTTDTANENNSLKIAIEGEGNFQSVQLPDIAWPAQLEHYEPTVNEQLNKLVCPVSGVKIFEVPFVAKAEGTVTIPPIQLTYYNISTNGYSTVQTDSVTIHVAKASPQKFDATKVSEGFSNRRFLWLVPAIALVAIVVMWLRYGYKPAAKTTGQNHTAIPAQPIEEETQPRPAPTPQPDTRQLLYNKVEVLQFVDNDKDFCAEARNIAAWLLQQPTGADTAALHQTIATCNECLYAPFEVPVNRQHILQQLRAYL